MSRPIDLLSAEATPAASRESGADEPSSTIGFRERVRALAALGPGDLARVALYRTALRVGAFAARLPVEPVVTGPFLIDDVDVRTPGAPLSVKLFGHHERTFATPPDWFANPWRSGAGRAPSAAHWSRLPDFTLAVGDVKTVWELSRFDWLPRAVFAAVREGDAATLATCERWLVDWCRTNPPNAGVNWKCAQEASLRALNLVLAWRLLARTGDERTGAPSPALRRLLAAHLRRVRPTTSYAIAQRNNHATSEAAALFCAGSVLARHGDEDEARLGRRSAAVGRDLWERATGSLILADGSFSQHSVTYHRLLLDTAAFVELVRGDLALPPFTARVSERLASATDWLHALVDPVSGDAPNLGDNDGAHLFELTGRPYRDFRPSLHRALVLFRDSTLAGETASPLLEAFGREHDADALVPAAAPASAFFPDGGYASLALTRTGERAVLRYPNIRFRPGHCDANHLDVWCAGVNLVRDGGTFSYNPDDPALARLLEGSPGHSAITFDGRDQMPSVGRFLRGRRLRPATMRFAAERGTLESTYVDHRGARHARTVRRTPNGLTVIDEIDGFDREATLRWRLAPIPWSFDGAGVRSALAVIDLSSDAEHAIALIEEPESRHYLELASVPVLAATFGRPARVVTDIRFVCRP